MVPHVQPPTQYPHGKGKRKNGSLTKRGRGKDIQEKLGSGRYRVLSWGLGKGEVNGGSGAANGEKIGKLKER